MQARTISIETLLIALSALDSASSALAAAPGDKAWAAYLEAIKARAALRVSLGLWDAVDIAETETANPLRLAA